MINFILKHSMRIILISFVLWFFSIGMLIISKNIYEDNHKKVLVREDFIKYSTINWVDETTEEWEILKDKCIILNNIGMLIEEISFCICKISNAIFVLFLFIKNFKELVQLL